MSGFETGNPLLEAVLAYGEARDAQLLYRRQSWGIRCEEQDEDTPPCYLVGGPDMCESCKRRDPKYQAWRSARKAEKRALKALQRLLVKAREGR